MIEDRIRLFLALMPTGLEEPMRHLLRANIEYLKALNSFIEAIIKELEKLSEEEGQRREKLKVE